MGIVTYAWWFQEPVHTHMSCIKFYNFISRCSLLYVTSVYNLLRHLHDVQELVVVNTHCLNPCLWGESDHPTFGPPASNSITPVVYVRKSRGDSVVCMWAQLKRWGVGNSDDGCALASTLCKYDLRKGDLFVLSWARVRRVRRGSLSSELLMSGGGVCYTLLLPLVARCLETIDVCIWRMFLYLL